MAYEQSFAEVYDKFTGNADYSARAERQFELLSAFGINDGLLLDLGCGTGTLSMLYASRGYDVIAVDCSEDMLLRAKEKAQEQNRNVLFLCQDMCELDLYGTVRAAVCSLDGMNHLLTEEALLAAFRRVHLFIEPGGVFLFDMNSLYKHREILGDHTFVYEDDSAFLVWQNDYDAADDTVCMLLDIFTLQPDGNYHRSADEIIERAYPITTIEKLLKEAGFCSVRVYGDLSDCPPADNEERWFFVAER